MLPFPLFANEQEKGEILYIVAYNADTRYSLDFISEFTTEYEAMGGENTVVIEAMNCSSLSASNEWMDRMRSILEHHPNAKMVMLYGPEAWAAYFSMDEEKYKQLPVCCLAAQHYGAVLRNNDLPACSSERLPGLDVVSFFDIMADFNVKMCYSYDYGVEEALDIVTKLLPNTQHLIVIGDNSYAGFSQTRLVQYFTSIRKYPFDISYIDGTEMEMEEAVEQLQDLRPNSAVLFCAWRYDSKGTIYLTNNDPVFKQFTQDVPIISLTGSGFGNWALGGYHPTYDWNDGRRKPSELVYKLLDEHENFETYYFQAANRYKFDQKALTHFKIDKDLLPKKAIIINIDQKLTFAEIYRDYKLVILSIGFTIVIIFVFTICILFYDIHLRRAKHMLEKSEQDLQDEKEALVQYQQELLVAKERIEKSDQMKTHFIQNMSHEIRTPLNAIQGFSQLLLDPNLDLDEESKNLMMKDIEQNIHSLTDRITDILLLSNLDSDTSPLKCEPIHINWICSVIIDMLAANKSENVEVVFETSLNDEDEVIQSEPSHVYECLKQLLANAQKFTKEGKIIVSCKRDDTNQHVVISITDNGPGIPEEEAETIFERFKKLDEFVPGTGLGLPICKAIAQRLHAQVYLDRTYTGQGCRFVFALPV